MKRVSSNDLPTATAASPTASVATAPARLMRTAIALFAVCIAAGGAIAAHAQEPDVPSVLPVRNLVCEAAGEPFPALKYAFHLSIDKRMPGNAATFYYRAALLLGSMPPESRQEFYDGYDRWLKLPLDELPVDEVRKQVAGFDGVLNELRKASTRESCEWNLALGELKGPETVALLLPEVQEMRNAARVLRLKAQLRMAEGDFDGAIESLRMGYQLGIDVAETPILINGLVGIAIVSMMNDGVREMIDTPGSPNLYWALAALPERPVDLRRGMQYEMSVPTRLFPFLEDAITAQKTPAEWRREIATALQQLAMWGAMTGSGGPNVSDTQAELAATALVLARYGQAKKELIDAGYDAAAVEKMPSAQVVAISASRSYHYIYGEMFKWTLLPYWQAHDQFERTEAKLEREGYWGKGAMSREVLPISALLMPAANAAMRAEVRAERDLAVLRTIEALRAHYAANGELPATLDELDNLPAPRNPITGDPFVYRVADGKAILDAPPPHGMTPRDHGYQYVIEISSKEGGK